MKLNNKINETLTLYNKQTGLELSLCDYFNGVHYLCGKPYFNVILKDKISESLEYIQLLRWANKYNVKIENNGLKRLSIYL